ncbi:unnamed protein product [Arctogadus glacialis]
MAPTSLNTALDERVEAVMIPCKRPGPQVCRADVNSSRPTSTNPRVPGMPFQRPVLALWRGGALGPGLPCPHTKTPQSPTVGKIMRVGTLGRLPPVQPTIDPIENDKIGRVGHAHGLYLLCSIKGHPCWALVDTGSTISIVRPGVLPETGWTPTDCKIRTATGELAGMLGKIPLPVKVGNTHHTIAASTATAAIP